MNFGIWELLVILVIAMIVFGTGKIGSIGSDLGKAVRGFRRAMSDEDAPAERKPQEQKADRQPADSGDSP